MSSAAPSSSRPRRGDELELVVDTLAYGGNGVARLDGYVVFVAGGMPGDRVRAVVGKSKRAYAEARAVEILEPSPERLPEVADHPGAPWQVLPYERQLEVKAAQVREALERIGRLKDFTLEPIVPAAEQWRYRNKLEYSFGTGDDGELVCGFHAPGRWDQILPMGDCKLASERGNELREAVLAECRRQKLTAWDRRDHRGFLRNLVVREGRRTGEFQVRLVTSPGTLDVDALIDAVRCEGLFWTRTEDLGESTQGGETQLLAGTPQLRERLGDLEFLISPEAFFQTNTEMAELLYDVAVEMAALRGHERVYDLYCGIGTIGLTLASRAREIVGVEIVEAAVADAIENARLNEIESASFYAGDIRLAMRELVEQAGRPDVAVIDPPRAGLSQKVVRRIVEAAPKRIVYVSCNPTTLAPNAAQLVEAGYELKRVRPVDLFPQTPHIECVALLEAGPDGVANPDAGGVMPVHRVSLLGFVNAYLVEEPDGLTLIDTMLPRTDEPDPEGGRRARDQADRAHARPPGPHRLARRARREAARRRGADLRARRAPAGQGHDARPGRGEGQAARRLQRRQDAPDPDGRARRADRLARGRRGARPHARPGRAPRHPRPHALLRRRLRHARRRRHDRQDVPAVPAAGEGHVAPPDRAREREGAARARPRAARARPRQGRRVARRRDGRGDRPRFERARRPGPTRRRGRRRPRARSRARGRPAR